MTKSVKGGQKAPNWDAIRLEYINGTMSGAALAAKYGLNKVAVSGRIARGKWQAERDRLSKAVVETAQSVMVKTRLQTLTEFDEHDIKLSRALRGQAARMLADASQPGAKKLSPSDARTIASLAEAAQKIGRIALGATTDNHGHGGLPGAPPIAIGQADPAAVAKAMNEYLHDY